MRHFKYIAVSPNIGALIKDSTDKDHKKELTRLMSLANNVDPNSPNFSYQAYCELIGDLGRKLPEFNRKKYPFINQLKNILKQLKNERKIFFTFRFNQILNKLKEKIKAELRSEKPLQGLFHFIDTTNGQNDEILAHHIWDFVSSSMDNTPHIGHSFEDFCNANEVEFMHRCFIFLSSNEKADCIQQMKEHLDNDDYIIEKFVLLFQTLDNQPNDDIDYKTYDISLPASTSDIKENILYYQRLLKVICFEILAIEGYDLGIYGWLYLDSYKYDINQCIKYNKLDKTKNLEVIPNGPLKAEICRLVDALPTSVKSLSNANISNDPNVSTLKQKLLVYVEDLAQKISSDTCDLTKIMEELKLQKESLESCVTTYSFNNNTLDRTKIEKIIAELGNVYKSIEKMKRFNREKSQQNEHNNYLYNQNIKPNSHIFTNNQPRDVNGQGSNYYGPVVFQSHYNA